MASTQNAKVLKLAKRKKWSLFILSGLFLLLIITHIAIHAPYRRILAETEDDLLATSHPLIRSSWDDLLLPEVGEKHTATALIEKAKGLFNGSLPSPPREGLSNEEFQSELNAPKLQDAIAILTRVTPKHRFARIEESATLQGLPATFNAESSVDVLSAMQLLSWYVHAHIRLGNRAAAASGLQAMAVWIDLAPANPAVLGYLPWISIHAIHSNAINDYMLSFSLTQSSVQEIAEWQRLLQKRDTALRAVIDDYQTFKRLTERTGDLLPAETRLNNLLGREDHFFKFPFLNRKLIKEARQTQLTNFYIPIYDAVEAWSHRDEEWVGQFTALRPKLLNARNSSANDYFFKPNEGIYADFLNILENLSDRTCAMDAGLTFINHVFEPSAPRPPAEFFDACNQAGRSVGMTTEVTSEGVEVYLPTTNIQPETSDGTQERRVAFAVRLDNSPDPRAQAYWAWLNQQR